MSQNNLENCPDTTTLADYLLGQLEPPTLDECESHIADCDTCHETLRGLSTGDTLCEHVADAFLQATESDSFSVDSDENDHVRGLVDRLLNQTGSRSRAPGPSSVDTEVLADRAAEVLRCVEADPNDQTLGAIGDYQLIRLIGAGSTGVVFQAVDQKLDRTVALKVLRPSLGSVARERFIAEARLAASIEHPNVVTIYQIDQCDRLAFIAMQWLPGQTLEAKLHATATMADQDVRRISAQVAAGLQAAHGRQLVHRDIKPANVWISDEDEVKILDFGLARIVDDDPGLTATGMLAGTPNFMSPEQTKGHELDGRSDLFSLGCMMYRMATGKLAFGATSILGTLQAIQNEQPTPPKLVNVDISSDLSDLTMALLEKQPANRPESAAQVVTMLEAARGQWPMKIAGYESPQPASLDTAMPKPKRQRSGGRWVAFIAASLLGFAGWYLAPQIIRIATDQGELVVESEDKDVEVQILQDGQVVRVLDTKTKNSFNIESGDYQIKAMGEGNSFEVTPDVLTMKRGQQTVVSVTKQPSPHESNAPTVAKLRARGFNQAQAIALEKLARSGKYKEGMTFAIGEDGEGFNTGTPLINTAPKKIKDGVVRDAPSVEQPTASSNQRSEPTFRTSNMLNMTPEKYRNEFKEIERRTRVAKQMITRSQEQLRRWKELPKGQEYGPFTPMTDEARSDGLEDRKGRVRHFEIELEESLRDKRFLERQFWSHRRIIQHERDFAVKTAKTANKTKARFKDLVKSGMKSNADLKDAELNSDRAELQLATVTEQLKIYQSVAKEFGLKHDQSSADLLSGLLGGDEVPNREDIESQNNADSNAARDGRGVMISSPSPLEMLAELENARVLREQRNASQPTFKGKPFTHWINITKTERSAMMLCDALRAGAELAETAEDKAKLLEVARTLARKHVTFPLNDDVDRNQYREALLVTMRTFEPKKVVQFVLTELEQGTPASIGFCSFLVNRYFYGGDTEATRARSDSLQQALVDRAPELLRRIVAGLERDETRAESYVLLNLEQMLTGMRSMWEGMEGSGGGGFTRHPGADFDQALVDQLNKQNKELAPTIRQLFLDGSAHTKAELIRLTRAFWQNDEQIELALQTAVLDPSTQPDLRRRMYLMITGENGRGVRTVRRDVLRSSPEPLTLLFLKKLLDNQLGPNAQRVKFQDFEKVVLNAQSRHPRDFAAELEAAPDGRGRNRRGEFSDMNLEDTKTIEGRPALVYTILSSLNLIVHLPKQFSSEEFDLKTIKPLLDQILAVETSKDPELQADLESMKTLLIFKNAKTLLKEIAK